MAALNHLLFFKLFMFFSHFLFFVECRTRLCPDTSCLLYTISSLYFKVEFLFWHFSCNCVMWGDFKLKGLKNVETQTTAVKGKNNPVVKHNEI